MEKFFTVNETEYPGFSLFDASHVLLIVLCAACIVLLCLFYARTGKVKRRRLLRVVGCLILACELEKDIQLILCGAFSVYFLPLHLCGLAVFFCFAHAFFGGKTMFNLLYSTCAPGALCAILFPDWTGLPPFCLKSLVSFLVHALITAYPLLLLSGKDTVPNAKKLPKCFIILVCIAVPIAVFNKIFGTNFMFLSRPSPDSPLVWFASFLGVPGYLLGYLPMFAVVWTALYLPFRKKK